VATQSIIDNFSTNPHHDFVAVSVQDSHAFCECDRCRTLIADAGGDKVKAYTRMYHDFLNATAARIERELPRNGSSVEKRLVFIAYSEVRAAPEVDLHPMLLPIIVERFYDTPVPVTFSDPGARIPAAVRAKGWYKTATTLFPKQQESQWCRDWWRNREQWSQHADAFGLHDWAHGRGYLIPNLFTGRISAFFQMVKLHNLVYVHQEAYPSWGFQGPSFYINSRVFWDPETHVSALWRRFCVDMFGPGADAMYGYFDSIEKLRAAYPGGEHKAKLFRWKNQLTLRNDDQRHYIKKAREHLDRAAELVQTEEQVQRFRLFDTCFRLTEMLIALADAETVTQADIDEVKAFAEANIIPNPMTLNRLTHETDKGVGGLRGQINAAIQQVAAGKTRND
jgi:hypothetical protein